MLASRLALLPSLLIRITIIITEFIQSQTNGYEVQHRALKSPFCVPTDDLLGAKDDLLSEGGHSLSSLTEE